jgi:hypothetical protein
MSQRRHRESKDQSEDDNAGTWHPIHKIRNSSRIRAPESRGEVPLILLRIRDYQRTNFISILFFSLDFLEVGLHSPQAAIPA